MLGDERQCGRGCFFFLSLSFFSPLLLFQLESASQSPPTSAVSHTLYGDSSTSSPAVVCATRSDLTNQPPHTLRHTHHTAILSPQCNGSVRQTAQCFVSSEDHSVLSHWSTTAWDCSWKKNRGPRSCVELYQRVKLSPNAFSSFPRTVTFFFFFHFFKRLSNNWNPLSLQLKALEYSGTPQKTRIQLLNYVTAATSP